MILLGAFAGLRITDASTLKWQSFDLEEATLTFQPMKTRRTDTRPLTIALHPEIVAHFSSIERGIGNAPVFPNLKTPLSNPFRKIMVAAGVDRAKSATTAKGAGHQFFAKSFHSLRHTMISRMVEADVSSDVRRMVSGHDSEAAHNRYVHISLGHQRTAIAKVPGLGADR